MLLLSPQLGSGLHSSHLQLPHVTTSLGKQDLISLPVSKEEFDGYFFLPLEQHHYLPVNSNLEMQSMSSSLFDSLSGKYLALIAYAIKFGLDGIVCDKK